MRGYYQFGKALLEGSLLNFVPDVEVRKPGVLGQVYEWTCGVYHVWHGLHIDLPIVAKRT